ncbi:MAG: ROK family protein [Lachnospiraceae bacterium]|nr:ROK family protein [Lachnospiraceae bacterium]
MQIGGLDIGTTGCKLTIFDENGKQLDQSYYDYSESRKNIHEIDAEVILDSVWKVIKEMTTKYDDITGIGITSFGETFILTDQEGTPLCHSLLYTDPRGKKQCEELCARLEAVRVAQISGVRPHEMYSIPKLMWLKENRPDIFRKTKHIFLMEDFIIFHLTGETKIDYSLAARTMGFDIKKLQWSREIFMAADIDISLMSMAVPSGTVAGTVKEAVAEETGLKTMTKIICISHDQVAAAVGAGAFDSKIAVDGAGTVECITPVYDQIPDIEIMSDGNYAIVPYVIPGKYVCYAFSYTGGALLQWCINTLAKSEKELAKSQHKMVNELLESGSASPTGLLVLPHFAGAATPYMDSGSKGTIIGLTTVSTVADIYRGCMEGVVYEMVLNLEHLKKSGLTFDRLHATGGGAHSTEWMQMKADMLNCKMISLATVEAGTVGSAMLTGVAVGLFENLEEAAQKMVISLKEYTPDQNMHLKYMKIYEKYKKVYQAVRPLITE